MAVQPGQDHYFQFEITNSHDIMETPQSFSFDAKAVGLATQTSGSLSYQITCEATSITSVIFSAAQSVTFDAKNTGDSNDI